MLPIAAGPFSPSTLSNSRRSFNNLILSQAAALCASRASGVPEAPRSGIQQTQKHLFRGSSSLTTSTTTATTSVSSATSLRRPRAVSAAASSTQVDRDHTAASMDSSRGQALVAWLEVRLEEREREKRALIRRRRRHPQIEKSVSFLGLFFLSLSLILFSSFPPPL